MEVIMFLAAWIMLVSSVLRVGSGEATIPLAGHSFPAIYNFGDSNSDTGGMAAAFFPMAPECGETFFHRPSGRPCDGRLMIDFIADYLRLPYLSAYLNSLEANFQHGANFATGGATIRRQNESWFENGVSPFPLEIQVEQYIQFKARASLLYRKANKNSWKSKLPRPEDFSKALYTLDIGQNDIAQGFRKMTDEQFRAAIPDIVDHFAVAVQKLYKEGARAFWIHNTGPSGCMPVATVNVHNPNPGYLDDIGCIKSQNDIAMEFNKQLKDTVVRLQKELPLATLAYVDIYATKYRLISDAKNQGFEDPFKICCGLHGGSNSVWCGNEAKINNTKIYAGSCKDPSRIISWDAVHYTEAANKWIVDHIVNGSA